jgi:hypothetical protein
METKYSLQNCKKLANRPHHELVKKSTISALNFLIYEYTLVFFVVKFVFQMVMSHIRGSVTLITITNNYNSSQSMTVSDPLHSLLDIECLLFHCD